MSPVLERRVTFLAVLWSQDFREAVQTASEDKGAPVVPDEVLEQVLKHLPQLQDLNERLLGQLRERIDNWWVATSSFRTVYERGPPHLIFRGTRRA